MKRIVLLLLSAVLLVSFAACRQEEFPSSEEFLSSEELLPSGDSPSSAGIAPESTLNNTAEKMAAMGEESVSGEEDFQPELPPMVRVRWQAGGFSAMLQLPQSKLEAFWDHAEDLLTEVEGSTGSPEDGGFDYLVSSPYYSGQEALLDDLLRFSGDLPQRFYWINEDTVRAAWEIGTYLSVTCQDRVAHFDWNGKNDENLEYFDLFLTMSSEAELPDYEGNARYRFTPNGEWEVLDEHPGFEVLHVASEPVVKEKKLIDYLMG